MGGCQIQDLHDSHWLEMCIVLATFWHSQPRVDAPLIPLELKSSTPALDSCGALTTSGLSLPSPPNATWGVESAELGGGTMIPTVTLIRTSTSWHSMILASGFEIVPRTRTWQTGSREDIQR